MNDNSIEKYYLNLRKQKIRAYLARLVLTSYVRKTSNYKVSNYVY